MLASIPALVSNDASRIALKLFMVSGVIPGPKCLFPIIVCLPLFVLVLTLPHPINVMYLQLFHTEFCTVTNVVLLCCFINI